MKIIFNPHLIIIKRNDDILNVHSVKYDYTREDYYIQITDKNKKEHFKGSLNENTFIELQDSLESVTIDYYRNKTKTVFFSENLNLINIKQSNNESKNILIEKVKYEIDNSNNSKEDIELSTLMLKQSIYDIKARNFIENKIRQILIREKDFLDFDLDKMTSEIYSHLYGMGVLQDLDDDLDVSEIMVNAHIHPEFRCEVFYTKTNQGKRKFDKTFDNLSDLLNVFSRCISFSKQELNSVEHAIIEATRANGDRINIIIPDASESYVLNIRKFENFMPSRENMIKIGTITEEMDILLEAIVNGKANIGIGGEMGAGKTTFINYLLTHTNPLERKTVISTVKEIDTDRVLEGHDVVILNVDDEKGFTFNKQLRNALRTTADRIIVPESRGIEFRQVYEANLKTKGNIFTAHATTDEVFLDVCTDMYMGDMPGNIDSIKNKISKSIDFVIIMTSINNEIKVKSISEVVINKNNNYKGLNPLYYWDYGEEGNRNLGYKHTGNKLTEKTKIKMFEEGVSKNILDKL